MTDAEYVFKEDVKERKKMRTGAFHRKHGSKSKKCTLPSDYLTRKEKESMSGPVSRIKMNEPYHDWKQFRKFTESLQVEYLNGLIVNYGARQIDLSKMFGITPTTLSNVCKTYGTPIAFKHGGKDVHKEDDRWHKFINRIHQDPVMPKKSDEEIIKEIFGVDLRPAESKALNDIFGIESKPDENIKEIKEIKEENKMEEEKVVFEGVDRMSLAMNGTRKVILSMLESVLGNNCDYAIKIDINKVKSGPTVYASGPVTGDI